MHNQRRIRIVAALVGAVVLAASAFGRTSAHPTLIGIVGKDDAYKITLTMNGRLIKTLKAVTYTVAIHDDSSIHNYELDGPHGKSWKFTTVPFIGGKTVTLKLVPGKYKAYCEAHESVMFQHFTVTSCRARVRETTHRDPSRRKPPKTCSPSRGRAEGSHGDH